MGLRWRKGGNTDLFEFEDMCDKEGEKVNMEGTTGVDDVSGKPLNPKDIARACQEEMEGFRQMKCITTFPTTRRSWTPAASSSVCVGWT